MKKVVFPPIFALVLQTILLASLTVPVTATAQVNILTHSGFLDSVGYYHVAGEVQNVGDQAVDFVKVTATFYDSSDVVIATSFTYTTIELLLAGRKSPFDVIVIDETQAANVDHYSLGVTFSATEPLPQGLEILSNSSYVDVVGYMHVVGEIENIESGAATFVKVAATFYDETGTVVGTSFTYSDPSELEAGQTAPFEVILLHKSRVLLTTNYSVTAESSQYAIIPEFPSLIILPLFMISTLLAAILYRRKHSM